MNLPIPSAETTADANAKAVNGNTPWSLGQKRGDAGILDDLKQAGAI